MSLEMDKSAGVADLTDGDGGEGGRAGALLDNDLLFSSDSIDALINDPDAIHSLMEITY
tara:strand:- start:229 stop:405 length:177 start_codon:yes stop_codon:yes gene_type:complete